MANKKAIIKIKLVPGEVLLAAEYTVSIDFEAVLP